MDSNIDQGLRERLSSICAILFDVDGVLTDGKIILDGQANEIKAFSVKDGQLLPFMIKEGFIFGCISGRKSMALKIRMKSLKVQFCVMDSKKKLLAYEKFKARYSVTDNQILYIGDDINDLKVLKIAGVAITPSDGMVNSFFTCDYVTIAKGGEGVLREIIDLIIEAKGLQNELVAFIEEFL